MSSRITLLSLIVFVCCLCFTPEVQGQMGTVRGEVKDEEGNPIQDVLIRIEGLSVRRNYKVKTDKKGKFFHAGVSLQGRYRVVAQKEGYKSTYVQGVRPAFRGSDDDGRGVANFTLKKGAAGVLDFELSKEDRDKLRKQAEEAKKMEAQSAAVRQSLNRGLHFYNLGQYEQAVEAFKEGLEKNDKQAALWANLGNVYSKMKQYDQAIEVYQQAITLSPEDPTLFQNLGGIYSARGNAEKAREAYDKAVSLTAGTNPAAAAANYYNMGVTFINTGKSREAAEVLSKAVAADPSHAEAHYQLGIVLLGLNRIRDSLDHLRKYVELNPQGANAEVAQQLIEQLGK